MPENFLKQAKKIDWQRYGQWYTPLLMDEIISEVLNQPIFDSVKFNNYLVLNGGYYWDKKDYELIKKFFATRLKSRGESFLAKFYKNNTGFMKKARRQIPKLFKYDLSRANKTRLKRTFRQWIALTAPLMYLNTVINILDDALSETLKDKFLRLGLDLNQANQPKRISNIIKEENDLLLIVEQISRDKNLKDFFQKNNTKKISLKLKEKKPLIFKRVVSHRDKYCWLAAINWLGPLYEDSYYLKRIKKFLKNNPGAILKKRLEERLNREKLFQKRIKDYPELAKMISLIRDFVDLKQEQWDMVTISGYLARPLLAEIAKRERLGLDEIFQTGASETERFLDNKHGPTKREINKRKKIRAVVRLGDQAEFFSGEKVKEIEKLIKKEKTGKLKSFKGVATYFGVKKGPARLIMTIKDVRKMKKNEILVCPMTNPDYMAAIYKAKAIITDEGGLLCHAAIITRELKKPCIVGTKIATRVLKDGDFVEVDAGRGIVKIIKKA